MAGKKTLNAPSNPPKKTAVQKPSTVPAAKKPAVVLPVPVTPAAKAPAASSAKNSSPAAPANAKPAKNPVPTAPQTTLPKKEDPNAILLTKSVKLERVGWLIIWGVLAIQPVFTWYYIGWRSVIISPIAVLLFVLGIIRFNKPPKLKEDKPAAESSENKDKKDKEKKEDAEGENKEGEENKEGDEKKE